MIDKIEIIASLSVEHFYLKFIFFMENDELTKNDHFKDKPKQQLEV